MAIAVGRNGIVTTVMEGTRYGTAERDEKVRWFLSKDLRTRSSLGSAAVAALLGSGRSSRLKLQV